MSQPDDDELLRLVSEAFDADLGEPPAHLTDAAKALRPQTASPPGGAAEPRRVHRLHRHLAAAAASGSRHLEASYTSGDGSITTEVSENDEGRLQVLIRSTDPSVLYVSFAWTPISVHGVGRRSCLVTPLAPDRQGGSVRYDVGSINGADAIDIEPAEAVAITTVGAEQVAEAFLLVPTGSSRRAWLRAEAIHRANGDPLAETIAAELAR